MTETEYQRYWRRLSYGWPHDVAVLARKGMPRWMFEVEREEGRPIIEVVKSQKIAGASDAEIARSFEVKKDTLGHWIRKWKKAGLI